MSSLLACDPSTVSSVGMGQIIVARAPSSLSAVLGSCVGVAFYHPRLRLGVLAHVVLPQASGRVSTPGKFADTAIAHMLQLLEREGAAANSLVAKIMGGACMFGNSGPLHIGQSNVDAVTKELEAAGIRIAARDVGGNKGRRVLLDCGTGTVTVEIAGATARVL